MRFRRKSFIRRAIRYPMRLQEIARTLVRYGLSDWIKFLKLDKIFPPIRRMPGWEPENPPPESRRWELLRMSFEELGPTFIKLGQIISYRTDILPLDLVKELSKLQDDVQPFSSAGVRRELERQFKAPISSVFPVFDDTPIASASIAQVHRAELPDGSVVAVKIQRPDIEQTISVDLDILTYLAQLAERYIPAVRPFSPKDLVDEFRRSIMNELDFTVERQHLDRFGELYKSHERIYVPKTYKELSGKRIMTMEYIEGTRMADVQQDTSGRFDKQQLAETGADLILEQIYIHGYFHADPHPGNILVLEDGRLCFLDFGIVGRLRPKQQDYLVETVLGTVNRDAARVTQAVLGLTRQRNRKIDLDALEEEVFDLIDEYVELSLGDVDVTRFFTDLTRLVVDHGLRFPSDLMLVTKALIAVEGIGLNLSPNFHFMSIFEPFARKLLLRRLEPSHLFEEGKEIVGDYWTLMRHFPQDFRDILKMMKTGRLNIGFRVWGLTPLRRTLDNVSYRLIFGMILASLLVSSSLVLQSNVPPLWNGISIIGLIGYGLAGVIALGFLISLVIQLFRR